MVSGIAAGFTIDTLSRLCYKQRDNKLGTFMVLHRLRPRCRQWGSGITLLVVCGPPEYSAHKGGVRTLVALQDLGETVHNHAIVRPQGMKP